MEYAIGTIRQFETAHFTVIVDALPEHDLDLSWDDTGDVAAGLDSGRFISFVARARVMLHGEEIASDYLGGCVYESLDEFMDHRGNNSSYFADMVHGVCRQAREHMRNLRRIYIREV